MRLMLPAGGPRRFLRYPLLMPDQSHLTERLALRLQGFGPISCPVCGQLGYATRFGTSRLDFRDAAYCSSCLATNRQRQLAYGVCAAFATLTGRRINSLLQVTGLDGFVVYNTEAQGPSISASLACRATAAASTSVPATRAERSWAMWSIRTSPGSPTTTTASTLCCPPTFSSTSPTRTTPTPRCTEFCGQAAGTSSPCPFTRPNSSTSDAPRWIRPVKSCCSSSRPSVTPTLPCTTATRPDRPQA
jgi:hypothetical protein